jgi:hypothetical protein
MGKREQIEVETLRKLEAEWAALLPKCLEECAGGRVGLFLNSPVVSAFVDWPDYQRLWSLTRKIREMHAALGSVHYGCQRFLHYCCLRGTDFHAEPSLAQEFLQELKDDLRRESRRISANFKPSQ